MHRAGQLVAVRGSERLRDKLKVPDLSGSRNPNLHVCLPSAGLCPPELRLNPTLALLGVTVAQRASSRPGVGSLCDRWVNVCNADRWGLLSTCWVPGTRKAHSHSSST